MSVLLDAQRVLVTPCVDSGGCRSFDDRATVSVMTRTYVKPYEYGSKWTRERNAYLYMFLFLLLDAAVKSYQVQRITLTSRDHRRCFEDAERMDRRALYVSMSRFESQDQIKSVINVDRIAEN